MRVFTFHTGGKYAASAEALKASANAVGLECIIYERPDIGTWWQNCNQKCEVVYEALETYGDEPLIWNDSDIRYVSYPSLLDTIEEDFAAYFMTPTVSIGGTMLFNGCSRTLRYVEAWRKNVRENPHLEDDSINLRRALKTVKPRSVFHLPPAYCWNEKTMRSGFPHTIPVIEHSYMGLHDYPVNTIKDT